MSSATLRLTRCFFAVDETTEAQRANHKLREAPFCGRCVKRKQDSDEIVYTGIGERRHYARPLTEAESALVRARREE